MLVICNMFFVAVMVALGIVLWRTPRGDQSMPPDIDAASRPERTVIRSVAAAVGVSIVLLFGLVVVSVLTDRALARLPLQDAVNIDMTAHQWWWEVKYTGGPPAHVFSTANEMHIPVGRAIVMTLRAD